jgi:hypothetical protein
MATTTDNGALLFTADDFKNEDEGVKPPKSGNAPPNNEDDEDIELIVDGEEQEGTTDSAQGAPTNEVRFPDDDSVAAPLRGKTLVEAAELFDGLRTLASNAIQQAQTNGHTQQQQQPPVEEEFTFGFTEDDLGVGVDPKAFEKKLIDKLDQFSQAKLRPYAISQMAAASQFANQQAARTLPYWELFGAQIEQVAAGLPVNLTAQTATWEAIHDRLVRDNIDKVVEYKTRKASKPNPGFVENTNGASAQKGGGTGRKTATISRQQMDMANALGVDPKDVLPFLPKR